MNGFDPEETAETELDWKSQAVLWAIADSDGTADTGEIRSLTGIDSYSSLNHRINNKLEPAELIDVMHPNPDSVDGGTPAKVMTLTQNGQQLAEQIAARQHDLGTVSITDRMEQLEAQVNALENRFDEIPDTEEDALSDTDTVEQLQDQFDELTTQLDALEEDRDVLLTAMTAYDTIFERIFSIETDQFRPDIDADQQRSIEELRAEVHSLLAESRDHT